MLERAGVMGDPTVRAEELAHRLANAIELGDGATAIECAGRLAELFVPVTVQLKEEAYPKQDIRLRVTVEDARPLSAPVTLTVTPDMTLSTLKDLVFKEYSFHPSVQQWVIGKRLPKDSETLHYHGIRRDGDMAYLYIKSAQQVNLSHERLERAQRQRLLEEVILEPRGAGGLLANEMEMLHIGTQEVDVKLGTTVEKPTPPKPAPPKPPPKEGWECPGCTFINQPTRPGCKICSTERPDGYVVPVLFQPDDEELARLQNEQLALLQYEQQERERTEDILQALFLQQLSLLETDAVVADDSGETVLPESGDRTAIPPPPTEQPPA